MAFETVVVIWVSITYAHVPDGATTAVLGCVPPFATYSDLPVNLAGCG